MTVYVCPDCRCEHDAPAEAHYQIESRCFNCHHLVSIAELRTVATLARARGASPARRTGVRGRTAA